MYICVLRFIPFELFSVVPNVSVHSPMDYSTNSNLESTANIVSTFCTHPVARNAENSSWEESSKRWMRLGIPNVSLVKCVTRNWQIWDLSKIKVQKFQLYKVALSPLLIQFLYRSRFVSWMQWQSQSQLRREIHVPKMPISHWWGSTQIQGWSVPSLPFQLQGMRQRVDFERSGSQKTTWIHGQWVERTLLFEVLFQDGNSHLWGLSKAYWRTSGHCPR